MVSVVQEKPLNTENVRIMFKIQTFNNISTKGLDLFERSKYEVSSEFNSPHAFVLRSFNLHETDFPKSLLAIGRAGAGVNNIPVDTCSEKGIVVFNTPGANANAVKELVILGMLLAARNVLPAVDFVKTLKGQGPDVGPIVEKNKSSFVGYELKGKKLGVLGLGAIGLMVANAAVDLGMEVEGYDPYLSVNRAWELSSSVKPAPSLERMLKTSDFISIHVPFSSSTRSFLNEDRLSNLKEGSVLLNFSRDALVDEAPLINSLNSGHISKYVTDFPTDNLLNTNNVVSIPHLGASTAEAEENCAIMIANQLKDFILNGNIQNSVNFPNCFMDRSPESFRLIVVNKNVPNIISHVTTLLADHSINILEMTNKSKTDFAYNIIDCDSLISDELVNELNTIDGVIQVRVI